jgi:CelD/BcsL family acetyltransferase involved in cellulose biosynthesis
MTPVTTVVPETALHYSVLSDPAQLEALRPTWLDLLERSAANEVMLTPMWLLPWWRVFGPLDGRQLRVGLFHQGECLVGLAPLLSRRHWYRPGIPFRRLEPLGSGERPADRAWSDYLSVIVQRGAEDRVAAAFAEALAAGAFGAWDELVLPAMGGDNPLVPLLVEALRQQGYAAEAVPGQPAPYIPLPGSWEAYLKAMSSSHRYFIKRSLRDFEEWAGGDVRLSAVTSPGELDEARQTLVALHTERWQAAGSTGVFRSPLFRAFHEAAQAELLAAGALDLQSLRARGQVVAAVYNLRWNGKISFYQAGRRTDLPDNVRPGVAIHAYAIRNAIEAGLREYDFLAGVSRYKMQFALATRPLVEVRAARRSLVEGARRLVGWGAGCARSARDGLRRAAGWVGKHLGAKKPE